MDEFEDFEDSKGALSRIEEAMFNRLWKLSRRQAIAMVVICVILTITSIILFIVKPTTPLGFVASNLVMFPSIILGPIGIGFGLSVIFPPKLDKDKE